MTDIARAFLGIALLFFSQALVIIGQRRREKRIWEAIQELRRMV